ncbi:MAG: hypothetical protein K2L17_07705 [Muribaculaceae bacterium]|nr:hypothetical protein [Muribaculaceae bacterium]MDE6785991.1 hypothetical protein [Muribaculaceae bacterium]
MKNYLKFSILFIVIAISACRSHKTVEVSNYSANDSCIVQTDLSVRSFTNIEKTESISSCIAQDHLEFSDGAGEIRINSIGEVSIKGLKSAYLIHQNTHERSVTTATTTNSLTATSNEKSAKITTSATKAEATIPVSSSTWLKIILFIIIIILIIRFIRPR